MDTQSLACHKAEAADIKANFPAIGGKARQKKAEKRAQRGSAKNKIALKAGKKTERDIEERNL